MRGARTRLRPQRLECTLLELVRAVDEVTSSERETIATLRYLLRNRRVRLIGTLRNEEPSSF